MKLLGWMHRKLRQNNNETPKDFSIGNSCTWSCCLTGFTGQPSYLDNIQKGNYECKAFSNSQRENYLRNSFTNLDQDDREEETADVTSDIFYGFLAIGTLGTEPIPPTPTFSISVDHILAGQETETTDNDLKLINDELEKVLGDDTCSEVSSGRDSHASTITLCEKQLTGSAETTCPLQSYLFGSSATGLPVRREHHRTSLGELFQKTKQADQYSGTKCEKRLGKETDKSAVNVMKKMLIRRRKSSTATTMDSTTAGKKLQKILHIFNRKVHPESSSSFQNNHKATNNDQIKNNNTDLVAPYNNSGGGGLIPSTEDIIIYPQQESTWSCKNESHSPQLTKSSGDTTGNEFWVKTDAEYLVLEL